MITLNIGDILIPQNELPLMVIDKIPYRRFLYIDKALNSNKFWEIFLHDKYYFTTRWGRINTEGQSTTKSFISKKDVDKAYNLKIKEKIKEGYAETSCLDYYFIYTFLFVSSRKKRFISYSDLENYINIFKIRIQRKK